MTVASPAQTLSLARSRDHIVDVLIAERAPNLAASPAWPLLRPLLYSFLDYGKARRMADAIAPLPAADVPKNKGGNAVYELTQDRQLKPLGLFKIPRAQTDTENCVAHNGNVIPIEGRGRILVAQTWIRLRSI